LHDPEQALKARFNPVDVVLFQVGFGRESRFQRFSLFFIS